MPFRIRADLRQVVLAIRVDANECNVFVCVVRREFGQPWCIKADERAFRAEKGNDGELSRSVIGQFVDFTVDVREFDTVK